METRIDILIDGSGSMGREVINGEQYLLPDGSSRTDLVKKILRNNIKQIIQQPDQLVIKVFRSRNAKDNNGKFLIRNQKYVLDVKDISDVIYGVGVFEEEKFEKSLNDLQDPPAQGTPLFHVLEKTVNGFYLDHQIIVLTDGDGNDMLDFDTKIIDFINKMKFKVNISFIGIDQSDQAIIKCKRIAEATNGSYYNLKGINYSIKALDKILFPLKSRISERQLENLVAVEKPNTTKAATVENAISKIDLLEKDASIKVSDKVKEVKSDPIKDLNQKVDRHDKALSQISIQLQNIVGLLQGNDIQDSITIEENPIHNQRVGRKAEEILFNKLKTFNWEKVEWLNEKEESFKSYDFYIENKEQKAYYECKGTAGGLNSFHLTAGEWSFYLEHRGSYRLCFVQDVDGESVIYRFKDILDDLEQGKLKLHHSSNHNVKANSITFFVNVEKCEKF